MPAHKVAGQDFNKLLGGLDRHLERSRSSFQSWQKGTQLTIVKNAAFKAGPKAKLDRIVFRYIAGASQFQALKSGEGDVVEPQPQVQIVDFYKDNKFKVQVGPSYQWEHLDFQQGAKAHPALKKKFVRQAIIQGINRAQIREVLYVEDGARAESEADAGAPEQHLQAVRGRVRSSRTRAGSSARRTRSHMLKKNGCTGGPDTAERWQLEASSAVQGRRALVRSSPRRRPTRSGR